VKNIWSVHFNYFISTNMQMETTTFCLCTRLRVHIFKVNDCQCKLVFS